MSEHLTLSIETRLLLSRCLAHLEHEDAGQAARELAADIRKHLDYPSISTPTRQHALPPGLPQFEGFVYTGEWRAPLRDEWFVAHAYDRDPRRFPLYAIPMRAVYQPHPKESRRYILRKLPAAQCEAMISNGGTGENARQCGAPAVAGSRFCETCGKEVKE